MTSFSLRKYDRPCYYGMPHQHIDMDKSFMYRGFYALSIYINKQKLKHSLEQTVAKGVKKA